MGVGGRKPLELTGQKFGKWLVTGKAPQHPMFPGSTWHVQCECGSIQKIIGAQLRAGYSKQCMKCWIAERSENAQSTQEKKLARQKLAKFKFRTFSLSAFLKYPDMRDERAQ